MRLLCTSRSACCAPHGKYDRISEMIIPCDHSKLTVVYKKTLLMTLLARPSRSNSRRSKSSFNIFRLMVISFNECQGRLSGLYLLYLNFKTNLRSSLETLGPYLGLLKDAKQNIVDCNVAVTYKESTPAPGHGFAPKFFRGLLVPDTEAPSLLTAFLDVEGVFDNFCVDILLEKLAALGCLRRVVKFVKFVKFVTRQRFIHLQGDSFIRHMLKGVPQGAVLSPLLYSLFVALIAVNISPSVRISQFADDVSIFVMTGYPEKGVGVLEGAISELEHGLDSIGLNISSSKSKFIHFNNRKFPPGKMKIKIQDHIKELYESRKSGRRPSGCFSHCIFSILDAEYRIHSRERFDPYNNSYSTQMYSAALNVSLGQEIKSSPVPNRLLNDYIGSREATPIYTDGSKVRGVPSVGYAVYCSKDEYIDSSTMIYYFLDVCRMILNAILDQFVSMRSQKLCSTTYWRCQRKTQCSARITTVQNGHELTVKKGGDAESHEPANAPNPEEVEALRIMSNLKRKAAEHPEAPPSRLMRCLQDADDAVLAQLPDRMNIRKQLQRERLKEIPSNPTSIEDLQAIPDMFQTTKLGENFLLYDSLNDNLACGRIIMLI
ncbi:unnamed protein product [Trichogramma brassicae]|uniref:Reverse transcriptase domain-containing protein n=1 Tax=Trichogramma brassicae TaxID=86971 RepID=A0A6H5IKK9_9HYME|nr:unnamed protein product [Trichogramma brassicae]